MTHNRYIFSSDNKAIPQNQNKQNSDEQYANKEHPSVHDTKVQMGVKKDVSNPANFVLSEALID